MAKEKTETKTENSAAVPALYAGADGANLPAEVTSGGWGAIEEMETTDLLVPKIYHQQALSKFVKEELARSGDWCDNLTGEVLAKRDDKLEIIVFAMFKTMIISKLDGYGGKFKLDKIIQVTPENAKEMADKPFTEEIDGVQHKNSLTYNFYCLLPSKIDELPFVLTMASTKTKAARKLGTMIYKLSQLRRPSASVVFELKSILEQKGDDSWYGCEINQGRNVTAIELLRAHAWYTKSKSQKFTVVEDEIADKESKGNVVESDSIPF